MKETIDKKIKPKLAINLQFEPIDEKPLTGSSTTGRTKTGSNTSKVSSGGGNKSKDN